ncbi:MAG: tRNA lysidine(34) synthetase TilS [Magnetococcales bacterium]|nr:tRNA lysidine(34) synthetase TilS [Magnetococcales bacterium]NGZ27362.1 tRNA lysidine(34) synthetase TilS [Magnetococcales bacterium]
MNTSLDWVHPDCRAWFQGENPMVLGVSGGADSMALLYHTLESAARQPEQVVVGHFNHHVRENSHEDEQFVRLTCQRLGVHCQIAHWTPCQTGNLYEEARLARYEFLTRLALQWGAPAVAVAHHGDDQGETFLQHLLRGSGLRGLTGISPSRRLAQGVQLLRPLLHWRRGEIEAWLTARNLTWCHDPGNDSIQRQRGWLRHQVIPGLEQTLQKDPIPALMATSSRLHQADAALEWMVEEIWPQLQVDKQEDCLVLQAAPLARLPAELVKRVVERCRSLVLEAPHPIGQRGATGIIRQLYSSQPHWLVEVNGITLCREGEKITIFKGRRRKKTMNG